jgi:hypothetical protein
VNLAEEAARLAVLRELRDRLDDEISQARTAVFADLAAARAAMGMKSADVRLPDGAKLGTVTITEPSDGIDVDPAGFLAWVQAHHPGEVVPAVREPFRRKVIGGLVIAAGQVIFADTAELVPWATVRLAGEPTTFAYRPAKTASAAIEAAYRAGALGHALLPSIEAPEGVAEDAP